MANQSSAELNKQLRSRRPQCNAASEPVESRLTRGSAFDVQADLKVGSMTAPSPFSRLNAAACHSTRVSRHNRKPSSAAAVCACCGGTYALPCDKYREGTGSGQSLPALRKE